MGMDCPCMAINSAIGPYYSSIPRSSLIRSDQRQDGSELKATDGGAGPRVIETSGRFLIDSKRSAPRPRPDRCGVGSA